MIPAIQYDAPACTAMSQSSMTRACSIRPSCSTLVFNSNLCFLLAPKLGVTREEVGGLTDGSRSGILPKAPSHKVEVFDGTLAQEF